MVLETICKEENRTPQKRIQETITREAQTQKKKTNDLERMTENIDEWRRLPSTLCA